jgi:hypothetical protein
MSSKRVSALSVFHDHRHAASSSAIQPFASCRNGIRTLPLFIFKQSELWNVVFLLGHAKTKLLSHISSSNSPIEPKLVSPKLKVFQAQTTTDLPFFCENYHCLLTLPVNKFHNELTSTQNTCNEFKPTIPCLQIDFSGGRCSGQTRIK